MSVNGAVGELKGVGEKTAKLYEKMGIYTINDLLSYYPRSYDVFEEPIEVDHLEGEGIVAISGIVKNRPVLTGNPRLQIVTMNLSGVQKSIKLVWFRMPFLRSKLLPGSCYIFRGKVILKNSAYTMEQPKIYTYAEYERLKHSLQPVYPLTKGVTSQSLAKMMRQALALVGSEKEWLPDEIRERYQLAEYNYALERIHFPITKEDLIFARKRLVFDEFFTFLYQIRCMKESNQQEQNQYCFEKNNEKQRLLNSLSYELTGAQKRVLKEIEEDMTGETIMNRLIQGDVGSGKTILAILALIRVIENGYQGALMAPTEVLAKQHYESVTKLFEEAGINFKVCLLTGSMTAKEKRLTYEEIQSNQVQLIIGTHALIQEKVEYNNLALVITDEQHRFGVKQREALTKKGIHPHVLVMSATPIPRTLAIMLYGDMDLSVVDELPANRLPIKNCVVGLSYRKTAYQFMEKQIAQGRQVYIICPMVEESESMEGENVIDYTKMIKSVFSPSVRIEFLHGKMKQSQKDELMEAFAQNEIQILVSTTVIEVGINVPNATVMMIENAERFGLAQLHQLRGRVGRGAHQSYCIFMMGNDGAQNKSRLEILNQSNDGFYVASEDLKLRGPGDFFGIRQSGILDFKIGDIYQDATVLSQASEALEIIKGTEFEKRLKKRAIQGTINL